MHVIVTCKYGNERMKNSRGKVETSFFPSLPYLLPWKPVVGSSRISNSSNLSCMISLSASMKRIRSRTAENKWRHRFSNCRPMGIFFGRSREANSAVGGPIRLVRALLYVIMTCNYQKDWMKNGRGKSGDIVFSIITLWELSVAMETRVLIRSGPKPNAAFPPSNDASDKIWLRSTHWSQRYSCLKV